MSVHDLKVGDQGQRYEVRCKGWTVQNAEQEAAWGWTNVLSSTYTMVECINLHPTLHSPRVIDRQTGEDIPLPRSALH